MRPQILILAVYLIAVGCGYLLEYLNISHLRRRGGRVPPEFEGQIDPDLLKKAEAYIIENTRFRLLSSTLGNAVLLTFIFTGPLEAYSSFIASLGLSFIPSGILFFIILFYVEVILSAPLSLYRTFRIENKYGFNKMTPVLWVADALKSALVSTALMAVTITGGLWIIEVSPRLWWVWIWFFFLLFSLFMMYISPYLIEPLFHRFEEIDDKALEGRIQELMERAGITVRRVFKVDASRRTTHTNAYFTGIGRVKRIVLYDTLLERLSPEEILSVLAHEAGHWKKKHLLKNIVLVEAVSLAALFIASLLLEGDLLNDLLNIKEGTFFTKVFILGFLGSIAALPFEPFFNYISRRHERAADRYACVLSGRKDDFIGALVKLSKDNLSNLHPHPLYVLFHYSHPPAAERIRDIRSL